MILELFSNVDKKKIKVMTHEKKFEFIDASRSRQEFLT